MTVEQVVDVFRQGLSVAIRVGGPILLLCMLVGVIVAVLQAVTQIHEQSIAFVLKLMLVVLFLMVGGSWMMRSLQEFTISLFQLMT